MLGDELQKLGMLGDELQKPGKLGVSNCSVLGQFT